MAGGCQRIVLAILGLVLFFSARAAVAAELPDSALRPQNGHTRRISDLALVVGDSLLSRGLDSRICRWDIAARRALDSAGGSNPIGRMLLSPNGRYVAEGYTISGSSVKFCGPRRLRALENVADPPKAVKPVGLPLSADIMAWSPHIRYLARNYGNRIVLVYECPHGNALKLLQVFDPIRDVAFSPSGRTLAIATSSGQGKVAASRIALVETASWRVNREIIVPDGSVTSMLYVSDSRLVVTRQMAWNSKSDRARYFVEACDVHGHRERCIPLPAASTRMTGGADGRVAIGAIRDIACSADASHLLSLPASNDEVAVWSTVVGRMLYTLNLPEAGSLTTLDPGGEGVATLKKGSVQVWDMTEPTAPVAPRVTLDAPAGHIRRLTFAASDPFLAAYVESSSGSAPNKCLLWNLRDGRLTLTFSCGEVSALALRPDGSEVALVEGADRWLRRCAPGSGRIVAEIPFPLPRASLRSPLVAYSADGQLIATARDDQMTALRSSDLSEGWRARTTGGTYNGTDHDGG